MQYTAIKLCPDGGIVRHPETSDVANIMVGDFDTLQDAVNQACQTLDCSVMHPLGSGLISRGRDRGGYLIITTQELEAV